jgi:hypothetical protein
MTIDADEAAIRKVIAIALVQQGEIDGLGLDALVAMRQAEAIVKALGHAGAGVSAAMAEGSSRFPPPRRFDKITGGYVARDVIGQSLAYLYSRETKPRRARRRC